MSDPILLFVDDERVAPAGWLRVTTSAAALELLRAAYLGGPRIAAVSLDHDLGGSDTTRPIVDWMERFGQWPDEIGVHTANPVGRAYLTAVIRRAST